MIKQEPIFETESWNVYVRDWEMRHYRRGL